MMEWIYGNLSVILVDSNHLKTFFSKSKFGSDDDYRTPPIDIRLWPILAIFRLKSEISPHEAGPRAKKYFGAQTP